MSTLIQINNLYKSYGPQVIFDDANLSINAKQKIGVIGRNGAGKTTLFRMLVNQEKPDSGQVVVHKKAHLGYLEQLDPYLPGETVIDFLTRYTNKEEWQCAKIAANFQLKNDLLTAQISALAGGYQMRVKLSAMLLKDPNLLLLDEPTNYLDLSTLLLLEQFLKTYNGGFLLISHDREFLKNVCDHTLEVERGGLFLYPQSLENYFEYKQEQAELKLKFNQKVDIEQKHLKTFIDRFGAKASKAKQAKSKQKRLDSLTKIEIAHPLSTVRISIPRIEDKKGLAMRCKNLAIGYQDYAVADNIDLEVERGEHIAILGDNGQGKTTFLKTLADQLSPLSGEMRWMPNIKVAYYAQHTPSLLNPLDQVENYLKYNAAPDVSAQDIYRMAGNFLFKEDDLKKKIAVLSGGERARLCLASLLLQKAQVMLLDEPNNHLDFETVEALACALKECNSTVLFVSHNRTFVNVLATGIIELKNKTASRYKHNYEEYVYHLELMLAANDDRVMEDSSCEEDEDVELNDFQKKKNLQKELRSAEKESQKAEASLCKFEAEKVEILKDFDKNPAYSKERNDRLTQVTKSIDEQEKKWVVLQEKVEVLQKKL